MMKSALLLATLALSQTVDANQMNQFWQDSTYTWNFRYRLEQVQAEGALKDALASTLRSRLTVNTGKWTLGNQQQLSVLLEADHVALIGAENYNNTVNSLSRYATIADPNGLDLNQATLLFKATDSSLITLGRQRLNLDNQRFIGSVGWRQNEQTFDGIRLNQQFGSNIRVDLASLHNANRVFGPDGPNADLHGRFNMAQAQWTVKPEHVLQTYLFDLDFDTLSARTSTTKGIDYKGHLKNLKWQLAYANQQDAHQTSSSYQVDYHRVELSYPIEQFTFKGTIERLGSDGKVAFQTPFATLHAFNGFADMFLITPTHGLREQAFHLAFPLLNAKGMVSWHRFHSDVVKVHYGDEIDASLAYELNSQWQILSKIAFYNADKLYADTRKYWFMLTYQP